MPRLKNIINDKTRPTQVVMTEGTVVYKVEMGDEEPKLGHYIESEKVGKTLVFRFATKKEDLPALRIETKPEFTVSFD
jgi:hypothetical protein